jgi:hypothetical protein
LEFLLQKFRVIGNQGVRMKIMDEVPSLTLVTHPSPSQEGIFFQKGTSDGKFSVRVSFSRSLKFLKI